MSDRDPDRQFARFAETGDPAALADVFDRTAPEVLRVAFHLSGDAAEAEDLLQATFVAAIEAAPRFEPGRRVLPWLLGILANLARRVRARRQTAPLPRTEPPDGAAGPAAAAGDREVRREVSRAIDGLSEPYRRTLLLRLEHGLSPAEIARVLDAPPATVRSWIRRGLAKLRKALPAGFAASALLAIPAVRGLAAVRAAVLAQLPAGPVAAASGAALAGALAMKKTIAVTAAVLVLALAGASVHLLSGGDPGVTAPPRSARDGHATRGGASEPRDGVAPTSEAALPPPVDPATVDRDRDLHGVVVTPEGKPVPGARLETDRPRWPRVHFVLARTNDERVPGPSAVTAADGTFRIRLPARSTWTLRLATEGRAGGRLYQVRAGERVRIVLPGPAALAIEVRDGLGDPLPGTRVRVTDSPRGEISVSREGTTDASGRLLVKHLPAGRDVLVSAWHPEHGVGREKVSLPPAGVAELAIALPSGLRVEGRVVTAADGAPIEDAEVADTRGERHARTDRAGRFAIVLDSGPSRRQIVVRAEGCAQMSRRVEEENPSPLTIELERETRLRGRVVDRSGRPVGGALVSAAGGDYEGAAWRTTAVSDVGEDGRFRLTGIPAGVPGTLVLTAPGRGRALYDFDPAAAPGETKDLGDLALKSGHTLLGRVLDEESAPLANVWIHLRGENTDRAALRAGEHLPFRTSLQESTRTDDLGRFAFSDLAPAPYELTLRVEDGRQRTVPVAVAADRASTAIEVRFGEGRRLEVFVTDDAGTPVPSVSVWTETAAGSFSAETGADGRAVLSAEGEVRFVSVSPDEDLFVGPWDDRRPVGPDAEEVRIRVWRAATLRGRAVDAEGDPVRTATVWIHVDGEKLGGRYTRANGTFELPAPARGTFDLRIEKGDLAGEARAITADRRDLVVRMESVGTDRTLLVRAVAPDGAPVFGVEMAFQAGGRMPLGETASDGRVRFDDVPDAQGWLVIQNARRLIDRGLYPPGNEKVRPGREEVVLRFRRVARIRGRVLDADGEPVKSGGVGAYDSSRREIYPYGRISEDGAFDLVVPEDASPSLRLTATVGRLPGVVRHGVLTGAAPGDHDLVIRIGRTESAR